MTRAARIILAAAAFIIGVGIFFATLPPPLWFTP
jgi:hypothetical protein